MNPVGVPFISHIDFFLHSSDFLYDDATDVNVGLQLCHTLGRQAGRLAAFLRVHSNCVFTESALTLNELLALCFTRRRYMALSYIKSFPQ